LVFERDIPVKMLLQACAATFALAAPAAAHEVWVERDATGVARIYLGEPAEAVPKGGDPEFAKLKVPRPLGQEATLTRRTDHIEMAYKGASDIRLVDDSVFAPWKGENGTLEGAVFHAREGRKETIAKLDLELVPVSAGSNSFIAMYKGAPLPGISVTLINPERWSKSFKADSKGLVTIPVEQKGRYILTINHSVDGPATLSGQAVFKVHHVSTLSFVAS
jgi:uncharacterized GH25 family protein